MKKFFILFLLIVSFGLFADGLSADAERLKKAMPEQYEVVKARAVADWGTDHNMVIYEISQQADALVKVIIMLNDGTCDTAIMMEAIFEWTDDPARLADDVKQFVSIPTDWVMVLYEYELQASAKSSY